MSDELAILIRRVTREDEADWKRMWEEYVKESGGTFCASVRDTTWNKLISINVDMECLKAVNSDGEMVAFTICVYHPHAWCEHDACCFSDSYVSPSARRKGVHELVVDACIARAQSRGSSYIWWTAHHKNYNALKFYDRVADQIDHFKYVVNLERYKPLEINYV